MTITYAAIGTGQLYAVDDVLDTLIPADVDITVRLPKDVQGGMANVDNWFAKVLEGGGVKRVADPVRRPSKLKAEDVLLVIPGDDTMEIARNVRDQGITVIDLRTGRPLADTSEIAELPGSEVDLAVLSYEELVQVGRALERGYQWRLAELSYAVDSTGRTLKEYSEDIGVNYQTLRTARMVYSAWQGIPGAAGITFGVLKELASQPDRADIVAASPEMTVRGAIEIVQSRSKPALSTSSKPGKASQPAEDEHDGQDDGDVVDAEIVDDEPGPLPEPGNPAEDTHPGRTGDVVTDDETGTPSDDQDADDEPAAPYTSDDLAEVAGWLIEHATHHQAKQLADLLKALARKAQRKSQAVPSEHVD